MYPVTELFGKEFNTYTLCAVVGIIASLIFALTRSRSKIYKIITSDVFFDILSIIAGAVFGAKFFQIIGAVVTDGTTPGFWTLENLKSLIPGIGVFYGGLFGAFIGAYLYARSVKINFSDLTDLLTPIAPLFHVFGRIGCFMAGCCYGKESEIFGIAFHCSNSAPNGVKLIPVQLIEAACNVLIFILLLTLKPERKKRGTALPFYGICYAICRFIIEFFRGDEHRGVFILSTSQWISIAVLIVCILVLRKLMKKKDAPAENEEQPEDNIQIQNETQTQSDISAGTDTQPETETTA